MAPHLSPAATNSDDVIGCTDIEKIRFGVTLHTRSG
jgi:hypothetical protein